MFWRRLQASAAVRASSSSLTANGSSATAAALSAFQARTQVHGGRGEHRFVEGEIRHRYTAEGNYKKLDPNSAPHYVKSTIQNSRRELGLPEIDDWHAFADNAVWIRTNNGGLWVGPDDPRASRVMRRKKKLEQQPMQVERSAAPEDPMKLIEDHPYRRYFVSPMDLRDPLSIAEGLWKAGYVPEHDVKYTATKMEWVERPPVVTIMGHVDHGKTTLLDYLRKTNVAAGEAGGITQSISSFSVDHAGGRICFVDTPGHAAFSEMRKAGATITDLIILIVSVTDGVQPQTVEVIKLAHELGVPLVVAINKIDRGEEKLPRTKKQLIEAGVALDDGEVLLSCISAMDGTGIDDLLDNVLLQAATCDLQTPKKSRAEVNVIDGKIPTDKTLVAGIVHSGTLKVGMTLVSGTIWGTITNIYDETGTKLLKEAPVCTPVFLEGFKALPKPGVTMMQVSGPIHGERFHLLMAEVYKAEGSREEYLQFLNRDARGEFYRRKTDNDLTQFHANVPYTVVIKAGTFGQLQALQKLIYELPALDGVHLKLIAADVGGLSNGDILKLNSSERGCILQFGKTSDYNQIELPSFLDHFRFEVVYHGVDFLKEQLVSLLPKIKHTRILSQAIVKNTFRASQAGSGNAGGLEVRRGKLRANAPAVRVLRPVRGTDEEPTEMYEGKIKELRRFKDIVPYVEQGLECGIILYDGFSFREGDLVQEIEYYEEERDVELTFAEAAEKEAKARLEAQYRAEREGEKDMFARADAPAA